LNIDMRLSPAAKYPVHMEETEEVHMMHIYNLSHRSLIQQLISPPLRFLKLTLPPPSLCLVSFKKKKKTLASLTQIKRTAAARIRTTSAITAGQPRCVIPSKNESATSHLLASAGLGCLPFVFPNPAGGNRPTKRGGLPLSDFGELSHTRERMAKMKLRSHAIRRRPTMRLWSKYDR
jgi:hypothetical protein